MERLKIIAQHLTAGHCSRQLLPNTPPCQEEKEKQQVYEVEYRARTGLNSRDDYERLYKESLADPAGFWGKQAEDFHWETKWRKDHFRYDFDMTKGKVGTACFEGGRTNIAYNCLDRHVREGHGERPCFLWEGNNPGTDRRMTYAQVLQEVCRLGNWLRSVGVKKGNAVAIYLPLVCELPIAMLACARIGAVHSVVFGGFSAESLAQRVADCRANVVITASAGLRGAKKVELKNIVDDALKLARKNDGFQPIRVLVLEHGKARSKRETAWQAGRDIWWDEAVSRQPDRCMVEWVGSEDPLFLLYTSGSTGKPKGVLHTTGGYMVQVATSTRYVFDLQPGDIYWCTADCGWITGHSYLAYGPLLCGATQVVYEGVPVHPNPGRCWEIVAKYQVRVMYTAPTLIRALEAHGDKWVKAHDRSSLRVLGTVGEPINPGAWAWFFHTVGGGRCPVVDTWWQTETGSIMISNLPGAWGMKPGSASLPFFSVAPAILDDKGNEVQGKEAEGILVLRQAWPSILRTVYGDHERFQQTYFSAFKGSYFTGDGCKRDSDGYYWITGRVDDVINVSGHRVGTAEVESALASQSVCVEAAVVGFEHKIKGQGIYAYVTLQDGVEPSDAVKKELVAAVRSQIGAFAAPDVIHWAPGLPKTRSGKIMRRVLRKIATKEEKQLGDLSTLADPSVVDALLEMRGK